MADPIVNFFKSQLIGEYSNVATSFTISTGDGALLPDPSVDGEYNLVIFEGTAGSSADEFEVVRVTAKSSDTLTVTRGQEGTTPITVTSAFHSIIMAATKKIFDDLRSDIENVDLTSLSNVESITYDATGDEILQIPAGTKAQRPTSPSTGFIRFNTDTESIEAYTGTRWLRINFVEVQTANAETASATISAFDAATISNVISNAERLTFNSSGDESFTLPSGTEAQRPTGVAGRMRYNTDEDVIEAYLTDWVQIGSSAYIAFFGNRGLFGGGSGSSNIIDYVAIDTTGNATDFGDLTIGRSALGACSNRTRGLFGGGEFSGSKNTIDFVTIATTGNATDFGDLTVARFALSSCSNGTRGLWGGGFTDPSTNHNVIDYITIATTGNAQDFGDLTIARHDLTSCSSETRGLFAGGFNSSSSINTIEFVTIDTTGNATDFGDLSANRRRASSCSDGSRGLFGGGQEGSNTNKIEYVAIDTAGNAIDFGDLTQARNAPASCSNGTRGLFGGGTTGSSSDVIDFVTIDTTGNATDFGDLTVARHLAGSCSGD